MRFFRCSYRSCYWTREGLRVKMLEISKTASNTFWRIDNRGIFWSKFRKNSSDLRTKGIRAKTRPEFSAPKIFHAYHTSLKRFLKSGCLSEDLSYSSCFKTLEQYINEIWSEIWSIDYRSLTFIYKIDNVCGTELQSAPCQSAGDGLTDYKSVWFLFSTRKIDIELDE